MAEAFERFAGIDLLATIDAAARPTATRSPRRPSAQGCARPRTTPGPTCSAAFSWSASSRTSARGAQRSCASTRSPKRPWRARSASDPRVAERFELYACGVELANGFGELTDPAEQRRRFEAEMVEKQRVYGERYPIDEDFLAALAHMPAASGVALGLDRLVMIATGARRIEDVLWTPLAGPRY